MVARSKKKTKKNKAGVQKKKSLGFQRVIKALNRLIRRAKPATLCDAVRLALKYAKTKKSLKLTSKPRIVPIPKTGGILPLIPIFAGLSALGALSGGASGIVNAVNSARNARKNLQEAQRHNSTMESIAMGKGVFLRQYKKGLGVFLGMDPSTIRRSY